MHVLQNRIWCQGSAEFAAPFLELVERSRPIVLQKPRQGPIGPETAAEVGVTGGEEGWILEVNEPMNRAMEGMGGTIVKRYRLYEKSL